MGGFRRRRTLFGDSPLPSGSGTPREGGMMISPYGHVIRAGSGTQEGEDGSNDLFPARGSSRRSRVDDLEDLMMMEAIRLSLAAEEDRKRREEKEAKKDAKKKAKEDKKEAKQAEKAAKKAGTSAPLYGYGANARALGPVRAWRDQPAILELSPRSQKKSCKVKARHPFRTSQGSIRC